MNRYDILFKIQSSTDPLAQGKFQIHNHPRRKQHPQTGS